MSGPILGADAESMMPQNEGSGWRPPREPSVRVPGDRMRDALERPARWAMSKLLRGKLNAE